VKPKYIDAVNRARSIIVRDVKKEKSYQYIKIHIEKMIYETINIEDIEHFNRYHFQRLLGVSLAAYIKKMQMEYAKSKDKGDSTNLPLKCTYRNVSRYKYKKNKGGCKMKKYLVVERGLIETNEERIMYWFDEDADNELKLVEAYSKEDALRRYSDLQYELKSELIGKETIFREFWAMIYYWDIDFFESFLRFEDIKKLACDIYDKYLVDEDSEPEDSILKYDVHELADTFFQMLNEKERKAVFCAYYRWNLFCVEMMKFSDYKERELRNAKNIVDDIQIDDIIFWNIISKMIIDEKKESYYLDESILIEHGLERDEASELLEYCTSGKLKYVAKLHLDNGGFVYHSLFSHMQFSEFEKDVESNAEEQIKYVEVFPTDIMYRLAEAGYDFKDGKNELATKILSEDLLHSCTDK